MQVIFRRTGERRYAVVVQVPGQESQAMNPAPGFDPEIPHDLVHYVVEAELRLKAGVFGRAARGAGTFITGLSGVEGRTSPRERARARRQQARRDRGLSRRGDGDAQLRDSERIAYLADVAWRRKHGQAPSAAFAGARVEPTREDAPRVERVVQRLNELAPRWRALPVGGELAFVWPQLEPLNHR